MAKKIIKLPSLSRVTANSTAILELPIGPTYHNIVFNASGASLATTHIGTIRVLANGNEIQKYKDVQRLMDLNGYYNRSVDAVTEFMLHFFRHEFVDLAFERAPVLGTADLSTLTVEIDLTATAPANIAINAYALIDTVPEPIGVFTRVRETSFSSSVAGEVEIDKIQRGNKLYQAIHFFKSDITAAKMEVDGVVVVDALKTVLERQQKSCRPMARVPVTAKATHIDFNLEGDQTDLFNANVGDLRYKLTLGTSGAIDIVTEELATLATFN